MYETLVLDLGNSRLKWGLHGNRGWMGFGATPNAEIGTLALRDWQNLPRPSRVVGVNVAGEPARVRLEAQVARWRLVPQWLTATAEGAGVVNGYKVPAQLGADRWASLVAARQRATSGELVPAPAVVINAGTAVTIDALDESGRFLGGLIVPGVHVMLRALAENTAALKVHARIVLGISRQHARRVVFGCGARDRRCHRAHAHAPRTRRSCRHRVSRGRRRPRARAPPYRPRGGRG